MSAQFERARIDARRPRRARWELEGLAFRDAGHGYDVFGLSPRVLSRTVELGRFLYDRYFRVTSCGAENIPVRGPAILASNHSGTLPLDAALIVLDVLRHTDPPRLPRAIGDMFIPFLPWVGTLFSRVGMVSGTRGNFRHLLEHDELVLVFPEGAPGIAKGLAHRYELRRFRVGHAELALQHRVPVIPVAVIGAEEAWPAIGKIEGFHWFGAPFLPIPLSPVPLPVHVHVQYGAPILLHEIFAADDADDPRVAERAALEVQHAVHALIARGLARPDGGI
jgi:1-acyl-sn-glycerol-3-phosphate acyltransferase